MLNLEYLCLHLSYFLLMYIVYVYNMMFPDIQSNTNNCLFGHLHATIKVYLLKYLIPCIMYSKSKFCSHSLPWGFRFLFLFSELTSIFSKFSIYYQFLSVELLFLTNYYIYLPWIHFSR